MAATKLDMVENSENQQPKKGGSGTAIAVLAALLTTYQQVGNADGYFLGNAPGIAGFLDWTKSGGATLTLTILVSLDGVKYGRLPVYGTPSSGASVASVGTITFAVAAWDDNAAPIGGVAGDNRCEFAFRMADYRYVKLYVKSDNASGSINATSEIWGSARA